MLHKISQACAAELNWIVKVQHDFLAALCEPGVTADTVTIQWVKSLRPDIDANWITNFCNRKERVFGLQVIQHMKTIANLELATKVRALALFNHNIGFEEAFDEAHPQPHPLKPIVSLGDATAKKCLRGFLVAFYDPTLYPANGYPVPRRLGSPLFSREVYVKEFKSINNRIGVCILCDGDLGDPDLDHFYSKKIYPQLSCHPANLIPICKTCNGRARKGEKPPLDEGEPDPMQNWFHPYLRSAEGCFSIDFQEKDNRVFPIMNGSNELDQKRLDNLDNLIDLRERWQERLHHIVRTTAKQLKTIHPQDYRTKLREWAGSALEEVGELSGALLKHAYYEKAYEDHPLLKEEIRIALTGADPVTG